VVTLLAACSNPDATALVEQTKKERRWPLPFPENTCDFERLATALLGGAHAPRADIEAHQLVTDQEALSLHIWTKVTVGPPLRVADIMSETLRLSANVTLASHGWLHFCVQNDSATMAAADTKWDAGERPQPRSI
jgi:hypothetical protein